MELKFCEHINIQKTKLFMSINDNHYRNMLPEDVEWIERHFKGYNINVISSSSSGKNVQIDMNNNNSAFPLTDEIVKDKTTDTEIVIRGRPTIAFKGFMPDLFKAKISFSRIGATFIFYGVRESNIETKLNFNTITTTSYGATYEFINMKIEDIAQLFNQANHCNVKFFNCVINQLSFDEKMSSCKFYLHGCRGDKLNFKGEQADIVVDQCNFEDVDITCNDVLIKEMKNPFRLKIQSKYAVKIVSSTLKEIRDIVCDNMRCIDCSINEFKCTFRSKINTLVMDVDTTLSIDHGWQYFASPKINNLILYTSRTHDSATFTDDIQSYKNIIRETEPTLQKLINYIEQYRKRTQTPNIMQFMEDMIDDGFENYV